MVLPIEELVNKISFDIDQQGVQKYNRTVEGMETKALKLGATIGATYGVKKATEWAFSLEQAHIRAKRWSTEIGELTKNGVELTGGLAKGWKQVQEAIPGTEHMRDFLNGLDHFKEFNQAGTTSEFIELFEIAGLIAKGSGAEVEDTFKSLVDAFKGGDLSLLRKNFPNFDVMDESLQNFVKNLENIDPRGIGNIRNNVERAFKIMREGKPELKAYADAMFGTGRGQFEELGEGIEGLATEVGNYIADPLKDVLKEANKFMSEVREGGTVQKAAKTTAEFFGGFTKALLGATPATEFQMPEDLNSADRPMPTGFLKELFGTSPKEGPLSEFRPSPERKALTESERTKTINQTFNVEIKADKPEQVGTQFEKAIRQAQNSFEPVEQ